MPITPQSFVSKWKLEKYFFKIHGCKGDLSDEEILEKLLSLNLERSKE